MYGWGWRVAPGTPEVIACRHTPGATPPSTLTVQFDLGYDATTTSRASRSARVFGLGAFVIGVGWASWLRSRDHDAHARLCDSELLVSGAKARGKLAN